MARLIERKSSFSSSWSSINIDRKMKEAERNPSTLNLSTHHTYHLVWIDQRKLLTNPTTMVPGGVSFHHTPPTAFWCFLCVLYCNITWGKLRFILLVWRSRSIVGAPGSPAGTCAGGRGWRVLKCWCISSPPDPPGWSGTVPFCIFQPEHESHCEEVRYLPEDVFV